MLPRTFARLALGNLPHLIGIALYGLIAIVLALLCYKLFTKLIPLDTGLDASPDENLTAVILAVGIVIGMSIVVAVSAYEAPAPQIIRSDSSGGSSCSGARKSKRSSQRAAGAARRKAAKKQARSETAPVEE